jgi:hypothetical protein
MKKFLRNLFSASTIGLLFQGTFVPLTGGLPGSSSGSSLPSSLSGFFNQTGSGALAGFFNAAFTIALSVGAILAVLRIAYAGWLYMSSDAFGKKSHAREVITDAVLGLLLLIGIYIILYQINPNLLNLNILQTIQNAPSSTSIGGSSSLNCSGTNSATCVQ